MKNLTISCSKNREGKSVVSVSYELELSCRKSPIYVNEKKFQEQGKEIAKAIKGVKGFKSFSIGFEQIDWYDSCDGYEVPYFICGEDKKTRIVKYTYNEIPKDWTKNYILKLEDPGTMRGINKFFEILGLHLSDTQLRQLSKTIKSGTYLDIAL